MPNTEECELIKSILGDYKSIDIDILKEGIKKIYDNEYLKQYQIELIKMQNYLEKTNKKMIILLKVVMHQEKEEQSVELQDI